MNEHYLRYDRPADHYMEALPLGNGSMGAMCYSGIGEDVYSLNHDTLWTGHPRVIHSPGAYDGWVKAREQALAGEFRECHLTLEQECCGAWSQAYMPFGDLVLSFASGEAEAYSRTLDLQRAVVESSYALGADRMRKTAFVSFPHKVLALKLHTEHASPFSFGVSVRCPLRSKTFVEEGLLITDGECPWDAATDDPDYDCDKLGYSDDPAQRGICFRGAAKVLTDGVVAAAGDVLRVEDATWAVVLYSIATNFRRFDLKPDPEDHAHRAEVRASLLAAEEKGWDALLEAHIRDHRALYDRVSLELPASARAHMDTRQRILAYMEDCADDGLLELLYNFGRYLLIASSRPGSQATNLQGIWNDSTNPPWNSNYTININTEMNYWPVLPCAMPELMDPLVDLVEKLSVTGRDTAREFYHARGFVAHHNTDLWGHAVPTLGNPCWSAWPMSPGWLCQSLYELYEHTLDRTYLRDRAWPILREAARFYLDVLTEQDGELFLCPATSPENLFVTPGGEAAAGRSSAMTQTILRELFGNCLKTMDILSISDPIREELERALPKLKGFAIGSQGQLLEWNEELPEWDPHHRHVSHLYGLYPGREIGPDKKELFDACRRSLEIRTDESTGWSMAWKVNLWARLLDGDHSMALLDTWVSLVDPAHSYGRKGGIYANLFDAHPPFQIDGNFGAVSGICEMLVQEDDDSIRLLPALPGRWQAGSVRGLAVRGGVTVDITWKDGKILSHTIHGDPGDRKIVLCR